VVAAALERIERAEPTLCAFVEVWGEAALRRAADVDARITAGESLPLAGVPIAVKGRHGLRTAAPLRDRTIWAPAPAWSCAMHAPRIMEAGTKARD
jgi:hypothetical protein